MLTSFARIRHSERRGGSRPLLFAALVLALLALACGGGQTVVPSPAPTPGSTPPASDLACGDGVCDGPETAANCPADCAGNGDEPVAPDVPPLYFFYAIHTHAGGDHLPYDGLSMQTLDLRAAENLLAAVEGIATVLDRYGVPGTWEVLAAGARGLCAYEDGDHVFARLQAAGHEVGVHAHRIDAVEEAFRALRDDCGITARTTSGFLTQVDQADPQGSMQLAVEVALSLGLTAGTTNLSPGGGKNPFGALCGNELGTGNDMWAETGNLMFPWRPDHANRDVCTDSPQGGMVLVDHVSIEWVILPGEGGPPDVLADEHFDRLRGYFDAALNHQERERPERVAAWGFVTHVTEYAVGGRLENPPDVQALAALDRFLAYVDGARAEGRVVYATAGEITDLVR
jgi:hypothetical protein